MPLYNIQPPQGGPQENYMGPVAMYPVYQGFLAPAYVNGVQVALHTQKASFFNIWPNIVQNLPVVAIGNGGSIYQIQIPIIGNNVNPPLPINPPIQSLLRGHVDITGVIATGNNIDPIFGSTLNMLIPSTSIYPAFYLTSLDVNGNSIVVQDSGQFLQIGGFTYPNLGLLMVPGPAPFGYSAMPNGYTSAFIITGISQAANAVLTVNNNFVAGQLIQISGVVGMTEINGLTATVVSATPTTATININSTAFTAYVSGGTANSIQNVVNYLTGQVINVIFPSAIPQGENINAQCYYFQSGLPRGILFYNNVLTFRSPPSQQYLVELDAYITPCAFLNTSQALPFGYMAEYIARGAARKILSDTGDVEQFQFYEPFFQEQEQLVWKRSQRIWTSTRTETIYSQGMYSGSGWGNNYNGM